MTIFYGVEFFYGVSVNSFYLGRGVQNRLALSSFSHLRGGEIKGLSLF